MLTDASGSMQELEMLTLSDLTLSDIKAYDLELCSLDSHKHIPLRYAGQKNH